MKDLNQFFLQLDSKRVPIKQGGGVKVTLVDYMNDFSEKTYGCGMDLTANIFPKWLAMLFESNQNFKNKFNRIISGESSGKSEAKTNNNGLKDVSIGYLVDSEKCLQRFITLNTGLQALCSLGLISYQHIGSLNSAAKPTGKTVGYIVNLKI